MVFCWISFTEEESILQLDYGFSTEDPIEVTSIPPEEDTTTPPEDYFTTPENDTNTEGTTSTIVTTTTVATTTTVTTEAPAISTTEEPEWNDYLTRINVFNKTEQQVWKMEIYSIRSRPLWNHIFS